MQSANARKFKLVKSAEPRLQVVGDQPYRLSDEGDYPLELRLEALQKWGTGTHSFLTLYPGVSYFRVPGVEGYIPLSITKKFALIIGQPVCAEASFNILVSALKVFAEKENYSLGSVPTDYENMQKFAQCGFKTVYIGREPIFNLKNLAPPSRSIRQAINRAKRKGLRLVTYHERYRSQIELLCHTWEQKRELPPMGFLFQLRPLELKEQKKYFLVVDEKDCLHAFLACSPIYGKNGWYLEDLIRNDTAPNGCTELLVIETLRVLGMEGYDLATLGLAPLSGLPENDSERPQLNRVLKFCFNHLSFIYHFKALEHFKAKFHPESWQGNYFCHYRTGHRLSIVTNLLGSFTPFDLPTFIKHKMGKLKVAHEDV